MTKNLLELAEQTGSLKLLQRVGNHVGHRIYILAYHRVDEPGNRPWLNPDLISATPSQFAEQMKLVATHYHPVSAEDVLEALAHDRPLPEDAVLVTVDDGYRDFKDHVVPITREYGIKPVLFVPTFYAGEGRFWWDKLFYAVKHITQPFITTPLGRLSLATQAERTLTLQQLTQYVKQTTSEMAMAVVEGLYDLSSPNGHHREPDTLTWDELRDLSAQGVTVAAHTHTHPVLSKVSLETVRAEMRTSQNTIQREIGSSLPLFAFPDGKSSVFTSELIDVLWQDGFQMVFTMIEGCARLNRDNLLALPRLGIHKGLSLAQFHLHLTPPYTWFKGGASAAGAGY
jgi:peptidoglycan/xylan/chitin deacetylase (PgdA/CDA1 family)